jgi:hypothetical protein
MKTTTIHKQVFLHRIGNHIAIRYLCFNDIYPCCIRKERQPGKRYLSLLYLTLIVFKEKRCFFLILWIKYVKHLCNRCFGQCHLEGVKCLLHFCIPLEGTLAQ